MRERRGEEPHPLGSDEGRIVTEAKGDETTVEDKQAIEEKHPPQDALLNEGDVCGSVGEHEKELAPKW